MGYYTGKIMGMQAESVSGIVTDGLKLYLDASNPLSYPGSGTTWFDLSENGNNGTMVNGVVPLSNAMQFDGVNDYVEINSIDITSTPFTISSWFNFVNTSNATIIASWYPPYSFIIRVLNGGITVGLRNEQNIDISDSSTEIYSGILTNIYYNIAVTYSQLIGTLHVYINGTLIFSGGNIVSPATVKTSENKIYLARKKDSNTFAAGKENDIIFYNRAITNDEVIHNFNATKSKYGF